MTNGPTSIRELGKIVGREAQTLYCYKRRGCPVEKVDGFYPVEPVVEWIRRNIRQKAGRPPVKRRSKRKDDAAPESVAVENGNRSDPGESEDYEELYIQERALKTKAQREREELKHEVESGRFIPLEEVKQRDVERIAVVKSALLAMPRRLAQELHGLTPNQIEVFLKTQFRNLLDRFSKM